MLEMITGHAASVMGQAHSTGPVPSSCIARVGGPGCAGDVQLDGGS